MKKAELYELFKDVLLKKQFVVTQILLDIRSDCNEEITTDHFFHISPFHT